ncbi:MAG TPA: hypothetical protein VHB20_14885 [Verrucomicrobiae bacterium]|nr:hypothetical protein [Verrucomicrobiae bacterium]
MKNFLKIAGALALSVAAVGLLARQFHRASETGEDGAAVWFYDESAQRLYRAPRDTIPPDKHGVRAFVVAPRSAQRDQQKIAYLETYGPPLKTLLEEVRRARAAGQPFRGQIPARNSDFIQTNTLVRRETENAWHAAGSPEGQKIETEWRSWRGPNGEELVVCVP